MKNQDIKRAIDTNLSGLKVTQKDMDAILRRIHEEESAPRRRKPPVAVLVAALLILLAGVAFATFTLMDYYEKAIQIEGEEQGKIINEWSLEHKLRLIDCMMDAGAQVNMEKYDQAHNEELSEEERDAFAMEILLDYYPTEEDCGLLHSIDIIEKDKGDFQQWSLEDRAWLSEQLMKYQYYDGMDVHVVPREDEITLEQALEVAYDYYEENYNLSRDDFTAEPKYKYFMYEAWADTPPGQEERMWYLVLELTVDHYEGQEIYWPLMGIKVLADGTVQYAEAPIIRTWEDDWYETSTSPMFWTIEGMYQFKQVWEPKVQELRKQGIVVEKSDLLYLLEKNYGLPEETDIGRDEAYQNAKDAILERLRWNDEMFTYYGTLEAYLISEDGVHNYCFVFDASWAPKETWETAFDLYLEKKIPFQVRVQVDAKSGEITELLEKYSWEGSDCWGF